MSRRWVQLGLLLVALAVGVGEGLAATLLPGLGWWLALPWALSALAIGMLLAGPPVEKAARLAAFGFSSVLVAWTGTRDIVGVGGLLAALGWSILAAGVAVGIGALAHLSLGRLHGAATAESAA